MKEFIDTHWIPISSVLGILIAVAGLTMIFRQEVLQKMNHPEKVSYGIVRRISSCVPQIVLSQEEEDQYKKGLADYALGNKETLNKLLSDLQGKRKTGVLPQMPSLYDHRDMYVIDRRAILVPKELDESKGVGK